jgi:UDP-glucose 4-epimerase
MTAKGLLPELEVCGTDWDTRDGTAVRDYVHVKDLTATILKAIEIGPANTPYECIGTGTGSTVLEVVESMKRVTNVDFRVKMGPRRQGDVGSMICDSQYQHIQLSRSLDEMCLSAYCSV